jgi:membrane fusion protein (multidrug efflux system)
MFDTASASNGVQLALLEGQLLTRENRPRDFHRASGAVTIWHPGRPRMNIDQRLRMLTRSLALAGVLCVTAACSAQADGPQTVGPEATVGPVVNVMTLQPQRIMLTTEVPGHTAAFLQAEVRPQVTGTILQRQFEEGADVRAGQVLYEIDPLPYRVAFNSAKAGLSLAEAIAARLRARRSEDLRVTERQDDDRDAKYKWALEDVVKARAALHKARIDLAATRITAPISGRIGRSTVTSGDSVTAGQPTPLATVLQIDLIYVDVTMASTDIQHVMQERTRGKQQQAGTAPAQVWLRLSDSSGYAYAGKLQFSEVSAHDGTGSVTVKAVFPNPEGQLLPGMSVRVQVPEGVRDQALLVPQNSVIRDTTGQARVLVVGTNNRIEVRPVTLERIAGDLWLIGTGLKAGERIVANGLQRVRPGHHRPPGALSRERVAVAWLRTDPLTSGSSVAASARPPVAMRPAEAMIRADIVGSASGMTARSADCDNLQGSRCRRNGWPR